MIPYHSLITVCWSILFLVWIILAVNAKKSIHTIQTSKKAGIRFLLFVILAFLFNPTRLQKLLGANLLSTNEFVLAFGVLTCASGVAFAIWARIHLGNNWGMPMAQKESPELVTSGPYRLVRHPIYTGIGLGMLGSAITVGIPWLIWFTYASIAFYFSAIKEEKLMMEKFPETYASYRAHTKMLIPFIY